MPDRLYIDLETYSECDIEAQGGMAYAKHPSTMPLCLGYGFDNDKATFIRGYQPLPASIEEHVLAGKPIYAHNATFDFRIWNLICADQMGWPALSLDQMVDTMALCLTFQVPASLADAGAALGITMPKNPEGKKLIKMCCKPDAKGNQPDPTGPLRAYFDRLFAYCVRDVEAMRQVVQALPREFLIPQEHELWKLTYEMNTHGVPVDFEAIIRIKDYLETYVENAMAKVPRLTKGYVNTVGQIAKIIEWCGMHGYHLESLSADQVKKAIADEACPENVRELLFLRQELGRSSTAKYIKLSNLAVPNGKHSFVHDNLQHHGAGTGRWAGRGFQIHNLPRASVKNPEDYIQAFKLGQTVEDPVTVAKALIRPMIQAPDDHVLVVSDYSSIENRVLHWLADDTETLDEFAAGADQYCTMAAARYKLTYDEVHNGYKAKDEVATGMRQMGKVIILGCIAEGTLVLTQRGVVPIEQVTLLDLLWDGETWVHHKGLQHKGAKPCIIFAGLNLTKDHEVYVNEQKEQVWHHEGNTQSENQAICLVIGKLLGSYPELSLLNATLDTLLNVQSAETSIFKFWQALKKVIQQSVDLVAEKQNTSLDYKLIVKLRDSIRKLSIDLSIGGMRLKPDALLNQLLSMQTTEVEVLKCMKTGWSLLHLLLTMLWDYQDMMTHVSSLTESIMMGTMNRETLGSQTDQQIFLIEDQQKKTIKEEYLTTYDLLNAGPNHRFTVIGPKGPVLVSNCGFGMGKDKFQETAEVQFGLKISADEAKLAVDAYREKYYKVVELWGNLKKACVKAVITGQKVRVGRILFATARVKGTLWLAMQLPSGKAIYYMSPEVRQMYIPDYEHMGKVPTVTHMGMNPYTRKWSRLKLIPGRITENAVQGSARECMGTGMLNVKNRMPYIIQLATVHDEDISMTHKKYVTDTLMDEYNFNLCDVPWADGLPLKAEGYIAERYKK